MDKDLTFTLEVNLNYWTIRINRPSRTEAKTGQRYAWSQLNGSDMVVLARLVYD